MRTVVVSLILNVAILCGGLLLLLHPFYLSVLWVLPITLTVIAVVAGLLRHYLAAALLKEVVVGAALAVLLFWAFLGVIDWAVGSSNDEGLSVRSLVRFASYSVGRSQVYPPFLLAELAVIGASAFGFSARRIFFRRPSASHKSDY